MKVTLRARRPRPDEVRLPAVVRDSLAAPGEPLDVAVRGEMEQRLGHDFADVRVHTDARAAAAAQTLDAVAFTSGADIVFAAGRYGPRDEEGRRLLVHELVHTLQQGRGAAAPQVSAPFVPASHPLEAEAAAVARRVATGEAVPAGAISLAAPAARGRIARQARGAIAPLEVPESPAAVSDLADEVARLLAFDPDDAFGRARRRLARLAPATREAVAEAARGRIPGPAAARLAAILAELRPAGAAPPPEADLEERAAEPQREPAGEVEAAPEPDTPEGAEQPEPVDEVDTPEAPELPEPEPEREAPVAVPVLAVEPVEAEEPSEAAPEGPAEPARSDRAVTGLAETAEHPPPEEDAADIAPVQDTEDEAVAEQDELDAEPAGAEDEAAVEPPRESGGAEAEADPEDAVLDREPEESGDPDQPMEDPDAAAPELPQEKSEPEDEAAAPDDTVALGDDMEVGEAQEPADADLAEEDEAEVAGGEAFDGEGGAVPIEATPDPDVPDVSGADPVEAMARVGDLPPAEAEAALTGVDAAAARSVGTRRVALAEQPPELERPTGAPSASELAAETEAAAPVAAPERLAPAPAPPPAPVTRPAPLPPAPPPVAARARAPHVQGGTQGELSADDKQALRASIGALPVRDPGLDVPTGPAPALTLEGAADPQRAHAERAKVEDAARTALIDGRRQLLQPAGEDRLVPKVAPERLRAALAVVPPVSATTAEIPQVGAGARAASLVAREQRGAELRAAAATAASDMRVRGTEQAKTAGEERRRSQEEVTTLVRESATAQAAERRDARGEVHEQRRNWNAAEHAHGERELGKADERVRIDIEQVTRTKSDADAKAALHIEAGAQDAERARREGEEKAAAERERGEQETSGPVGWLADKATAFFDSVKRGITEAFEAARSAVRNAIEGAKRLASDAIDFARTAVVDLIARAGDALIALGDTMLAGFPGLRDRFKGAIRSTVARAQKAVEELAEGLKAGVQKALDLLGRGLDAALGLLERGLLAAVEGYRAAVTGALKFANSVVQGFAAFAALIKDVAADPKQWLRNLAASAKDGVRNHLWTAFKAAIKEWFSQKVEEVLGLGLTVWNVLKKGGISLARIGTMAWEAIKAAIPPTLIQILIEKLISLLIPAAAAVMLIIEGLQAAWGTVQRVLAAFERFFAFLKAVRAGNAGPKFATAVAAAAIAVIDFVANWLLKRLRKPAGKIAGRIRKIAQRIGARLRRMRRGARRGLRRLRARSRRRRGRHASERRADRDRRRRERQERARRETRAALDKLLARRVRGLRLRAHLAWLKRRWRWRRLSLRSVGRGALSVIGGFSPDETIFDVGDFWEVRLVDYELPRPAAEMESGAEYEAAVRPYIRGELAEEIAAGRPVLPATLPANPTLGIPAGPRHSQPSPIGTVRVQQARGMREAGLYRVPEAMVTIAERDPATRKRVETEQHLVEATLDVNFSLGRRGTDTHKQRQIAGSIFNLIQRFRGRPNVRFVYHIIAPSPPPQEVRDYIENQLREQRVRNARFIWRIIA